MRTIAITMTFVVLNGLGFLYRTATRRHDASAAGVPAAAQPLAPPAEALAPARPSAAIPTSAALPAPAAPASAPAAESANAETTGSIAQPASPAAPAAMFRPGPKAELSNPARASAPARSAPQRKPAAGSRPARPRTAPASGEPAPTTAKPDKPDNPTRDDSLLKMEANPYKRGE